MSSKILWSDAFDDTIAKMDAALKARTMDFIRKFRHDPDGGGLDLKRPQGADDKRIRTARVTHDYRAVLAFLGQDVFMLLTVLPHDDAYTYAEHAGVSVNEVTGGLELVEHARLAAAKTEYSASAMSQGTDAAHFSPLFAGISDADLRRLAVSDGVLPLVRVLTTEDQLLSLSEILPKVQGDVLLSLFGGSSPEEVWADIVAPRLDGRPVDVDDVVAALDRPATLESFTVTTSDADLEAVLRWPMDRWRTYLHPTQRGLAYPAKPYSGPFRVTGGPGTGKTVVAVHRARALAERAAPEDRILMVAFNTNIASVLNDLVTRLGGPALADRIDVKTVDQLAMGVVARAEGRKPTPVYGRELAEMWDSHIAGAESGAESEFTARFLEAEWDQVILANGIWDRDEYLKAPRTGRGARRLSAPQRKEIWGLITDFEAVLRGRGLRTFRQIATDAARYAQGKPQPAYRHVIIDEAQDLHASHWRLLRAVVPEAENDMFLVGDPFQRIYDNRVVLSRCGIRIQGRAKRLTINYRTTRQILDSSLALMNGHAADDLDGGADQLHGYRSLMRGQAPAISGHADYQAELSVLIETVRAWHESGVEYDDIAVGARQHALVQQAQQHLEKAGVPSFVLTGGAQAPEHAGVRVTTLHRLKGMEFRCVALAALGSGQIPPSSDVASVHGDPSAFADLLAKERSLLFVAGTRAREALSVSWHGERSALIAPMVERD
jgi:superfamily I DNA/RNA helicase